MRGVTMAALTLSLVVLAGGCSDDDSGDDTTVDLSEIAPTPPPGGELLCDFLPRESVVLALGSDGFEESSSLLTRDSAGELSGAGCSVTLDGQDQQALSVDVDWALGILGSGFQERLTADGYNQLPDAAGLGFTWTQEETRPDDSEGDTTRAWLLHGDRIVQVWVAMPPDGRDSEADAAALAQQVVGTLELPAEWTLAGAPPAR
ncbi:hypothetical protein [Jiangella alkaliphila]|uniref:hypothetical protein n=1 Tax=Jiangella alkaliphila TaxID=419479 RepID=UPI00128AF43A|nr:hypothetical protein [Jiangella alkaliphila]